MFKEKFEQILAQADIKINGSRPWDVKVHDERIYARVAREGMNALGDAYIDGWWDCDQLNVMFCKALKGKVNLALRNTWENHMTFIKEKLFNLQSKSRAFIIGERHYDLGNNLYEAMLDKRLVYTCGYWKKAKTLDEAQEAKLHLVCKKIGLKKGQTILDIGCGCGSFAQFAAKEYCAKVGGITVSKEQVALAQKRCKGLPVEIRLQDYREGKEKFDHVISLGMFEHVGCKNYREYMEVVHRCLKDNGLFLLHTMGQKDSYPNTKQPEVHWVINHIFPNGMIPSVKQIGESIDGLFVMEDWHNFGAYYEKTMLAWFANFDKNWEKIKEDYSEQFYRMWKYYLMICAGAFSAHDQYNVWQIVLSKNGVQGGYQSIR